MRKLFVLMLLAAAPAYAQFNPAAPANSSAPAESMTLKPGLFRITPLDPDSKATETPKEICLNSTDALLRLRHQGIAGCRTTYAQPGRDRQIVTYGCPAQGWGRTELRRETGDLYQVDTQGIYGNVPFALRAEARRIGDCGSRSQTAAKH